MKAPASDPTMKRQLEEELERKELEAALRRAHNATVLAQAAAAEEEARAGVSLAPARAAPPRAIAHRRARAALRRLRVVRPFPSRPTPSQSANPAPLARQP